MRGLAVLIMIECHVFNSFARMDLREGGPYVLSQFIGGMAAPLFMFMAGMTFGFQMDSLERREPTPGRRWLVSLRRAGYILGIAYLFRLTNWAASLPHAEMSEITKVDILNCMGVAMAAFSVVAVFDARNRIRIGAGLALAIAAAAPLMSNLPWDGAPALLREYLVPGPGRGRFPFFPCASYIGFGLAAGTLVKRNAADRIDRLMQWSVLIGLPLVFTAQYFSNLPYSLYNKSDFWRDSPSLILIRVGIILLIMTGTWLWTEFRPGSGWSWMECLGKNSLMVYWVHVMLVYGSVVRPLKRGLGIGETALAVAIVTALMVALSAAWLGWKARGARRSKPAIAGAGS
jgi:uncharacterized membrane protein